MKLFKSLIIISSVTLLALVYVHQQVELVKLSYAIDFREKKLKTILDRKESLGYNIANLENPSRLENILISKNIDLTFPKRGDVFKLTQATVSARRNESFRGVGLERKGVIFGILDFFSPRAEAQAREK